MHVLFTFGKIDGFSVEQLRQTVGDARTNTEAVFRAVIVGAVRRPLPCGLPGCPRRLRVGKVFARIQTHHNPARLNAAVPLRVGGARRVNAAGTDLNEGLLSVRLQVTDNLEEKVPRPIQIRVAGYLPPTARRASRF